MSLSVTDSVTAQDLDDIRQGLNAFNSRFIDVSEIQVLACLFMMQTAGK